MGVCSVLSRSLQLWFLYSLPGSSVHGIFQARIGEWVAISYSGGFSWLGDPTCISCIRFFTAAPPGEPRVGLQDFEDSLTWMNLASGFGLHPQKEFSSGPGKGIWYTKVWQSCQETQWQVKNICMTVHLIYKELQAWIPLQLLVNTFFPSTCQSVSSVAQSCPTLCNPMTRSMPGLPVHHQFLESTQTHVHWVGDAIQPSHPLSPPSPPAFNPSQHQGLFQWVNSSHEVAKVLEFQLQHQSFQWTPRTDLL